MFSEQPKKMRIDETTEVNPMRKSSEGISRCKNRRFYGCRNISCVDDYALLDKNKINHKSSGEIFCSNKEISKKQIEVPNYHFNERAELSKRIVDLKPSPTSIHYCAKSCNEQGSMKWDFWLSRVMRKMRCVMRFGGKERRIQISKQEDYFPSRTVQNWSKQGNKKMEKIVCPSDYDVLLPRNHEVSLSSTPLMRYSPFSHDQIFYEKNKSKLQKEETERLEYNDNDLLLNSPETEPDRFDLSPEDDTYKTGPRKSSSFSTEQCEENVNSEFSDLVTECSRKDSNFPLKDSEMQLSPESSYELVKSRVLKVGLDSKLVGDYTDEVIEEVIQCYVRCSSSNWVSLLGRRLEGFNFDEVMIGEVMRCLDRDLVQQITVWTLDDLVEEDLTKRCGEWGNCLVDVEDIVVEISDFVLEELITETEIWEFCNGF